MAKKLYGTDPDQVPTNADLGTMAYQDSANVVIDGGSARINAARPASVDTARAELELYASGDAPTYIINNSDRGAAGQHIAEFRGQWDGTAVARMVVAAGTDTTNKDDGVLSFWTASAGTLAKAAEFTSGGNLAFPNGQGIDFSASEGSDASSSVLDDYEEGTWNPVLNGSTSGTFAGIGSYVKIGKTVLLSCTFNAIGTGLVGDLQVTGIPFTLNPSGSLDMYFPIQFYQLDWDNNAKAVYGFAGDASSAIVPYYSNDNSGSTIVQGSHCSSGTYLRFVQTFETA